MGFVLPGLRVVVLVTLLGIWAAVSNAAMLAAFRLHAGHGRWLLAPSGLVPIVWGALLFLSPVAGALVLTWWLAVMPWPTTARAPQARCRHFAPFYCRSG